MDVHRPLFIWIQNRTMCKDDIVVTLLFIMGNV